MNNDIIPLGILSQSVSA